MSLSQRVTDLTGVRAEGGPRHGEYLDDSGLLWRTRDDGARDLGGWYKLRGKADGSLVYKFEPSPHLASIDKR